MAKARRTLEDAEKQIALLVEENKTLAAELEGLQGQSGALEEAVRQAIAARTVAEKEASTLKGQLEAAQAKLTGLKQTNSTLTAEVGRLRKQVEKTPLNPLTVEEASVLFGRLVGGFRGTGGLEVKQASLNLKLATGKLGDTVVLLLPDPKSVDPSLLHEFKLDLATAPRAVTVPERALIPPRQSRPPGPVPPAVKSTPKKSGRRSR